MITPTLQHQTTVDPYKPPGRLKVVLLSLPPRTQAVLDFFIANTGRSSFTAASEDSADAAVFDHDHPASRAHWQHFVQQRGKPGIVLSIQPQQLPRTVHVAKPITPAALLAAAGDVQAGRLCPDAPPPPPLPTPVVPEAAAAVSLPMAHVSDAATAASTPAQPVESNPPTAAPAATAGAPVAPPVVHTPEPTPTPAVPAEVRHPAAVVTPPTSDAGAPAIVDHAVATAPSVNPPQKAAEPGQQPLATLPADSATGQGQPQARTIPMEPAAAAPATPLVTTLPDAPAAEPTEPASPRTLGTTAPPDAPVASVPVEAPRADAAPAAG
ncbi:MAG: hypothetical protein RL375_3272, partial [Pseudomonadota bacterium]